MNLVPTSILIARWYEALARADIGMLHFVTPEGERTTFRGSQPGPEAEFAISSWDVIRRMVARGDIAMGEDYIEGRWTTPAIEPLFSFFLLNLEALEGFAHGNWFQKSVLALQNRLVRRNSKSGSSRNIRAHYDVGNDFYSLWLDKTMTYSSALYPSEDAQLEVAQKNKYQRILDRVEKDNASVLEIGCGWGGFAEQALGASHNVTGLTISPKQYEFSRSRLGNAADIRLEDYRNVQGTFDTIVSIEMFEAVGEQYWPRYFEQVRERLKKSGKAIVQTITIRDELFNNYRNCSDFVRHYVFPGGMLPSTQRFQDEATKAGLKCQDMFSFGQHYAQTLREWQQRLNAKRGEILSLGHDEKFMRNWDYYLGMCAAAFAIGRTDVAQIELVHA